MIQRRNQNISLIIIALGCLLSLGVAHADMMTDDEMNAVMLAQSDFGRLHEGNPQGVPSSYDWFTGPVMKQGNHPGPNRALTGWGHAFWARNSEHSNTDLQLRDLRVYLCVGSQGQWKLVQSADIFGRQYDADFSRNANRSALRMQVKFDELTVAFSQGSAFHFWPKGARYVLSGEPLCGVVVTVQARQVPKSGTGEPFVGQYLIGLGADYWRDRSIAWNGKDSNPGIAVGRLRYVSNEWHWYAVNTASEIDTIRLLRYGFLNSTLNK